MSRTPLGEQVARALHAAEEWWCRHVTQRQLYRGFDRSRSLLVRFDIDPEDLTPAERPLAELLAALRTELHPLMIAQHDEDAFWEELKKRQNDDPDDIP